MLSLDVSPDKVDLLKAVAIFGSVRAGERPSLETPRAVGTDNPLSPDGC